MGSSGIENAPINSDACKFLFLKGDRIYHHQLIQFHFTTYDVRCGTDIVNPSTARSNIMLLADNGHVANSPSTDYHFLYARVLGVYHANVVYTGPGMHDYTSRRLDFLWVRWYEVVDPVEMPQSGSELRFGPELFRT